MAEDKKSFFATLPGLITAIAALIGALTTLYIALNHNSKQVDPSKKPDSTKVSNTLLSKDSTKKVVSDQSKVSVAKDQFQVMSILPAVGTALSGQQNFEISLKVHYTLVSADSALFVPYIEQFANNDQCATGTHHTIAAGIPNRTTIKKGEGDIYVRLLYQADQNTSKVGQFVNGNHVAPNASLWAGFDSQNRVIVMQEGLWDYKDYCYPFQP